jgi:hypothetical protein
MFLPQQQLLAAFIVGTSIAADTPAGTTTPGYIRVVDK